jgi:hypothetical protein
MLVLSTLHKLLSQILSLPDLHTAILLTTEGQLVSFATDPSRSKDEILVAVGLSGEVWQETREQGYGMVDSEVRHAMFSTHSKISSDQLGRILVLAVEEIEEEEDLNEPQPLMLLALNSTDAVEWDELEAKVRSDSERMRRTD